MAIRIFKITVVMCLIFLSDSAAVEISTMISGRYCDSQSMFPFDQKHPHDSGQVRYIITLLLPKPTDAAPLVRALSLRVSEFCDCPVQIQS